MTSLPWTRSEIQEAVNSEAWIWEVGDKELYELCARTPRHKDVRSVVAKLWLIGRSYATPLERLGDASDTADLYAAAAGALIDSNLDARLVGLHEDSALSQQTLHESIRVHAELVYTLEQVIAKKAISLASKYLHFHRADCFFIYDSRAEGALRTMYRNVRTPEALRQDGIPAYAAVAYRACQLRKAIVDQYRLPLTPRELDRLLWLTGDTIS